MITSNSVSYKPFFVAAFASLFLLASCSEDETVTADSSATQDQVVSDEAIADDLFEDLDEMSMEAATYTTNGRVSASEGIASISCLSRSVEKHQDFSRTVTLTFSGECEGPNGRVRTGTLLVDHSIDFNASTYTVSTTFQDFFVNGHQIEGTRTMVYTAEDNQLVTVNISLSGGKITLADGSIITREGNFTRTIDRENGQISLSGSASGTNRFGIDYIAEITNPLVFKQACASEGIFMPAQGKKSISRAGKPDIEVNFGDGSCDKSITLTAEGEERTVEVNITKK